MLSRAISTCCAVTLLLAVIAVPAFSQTTLVSAGSTWSYLDDGSNQGSDWRYIGFDDTSWETGSAQLGYGDGDEATVVGYGPDPNNKYITTYFRHSFTVADPSLFLMLHLKLLRDDGARVYLNGLEVCRSNLPPGLVGYLTLASSTVGGADEDAFNDFYFTPDTLVAGTNLLAVEIHQRSKTSSDISMDLELDGLESVDNPTLKKPYLIYSGDNTEMRVLWQLFCTLECTVEWGTDTGYSLGNEPTTEYGDDHQHSFTFTSLDPGTEYFYRVIASADTMTGSFYSAPTAEVQSVKFLVYGDTRSYPDTHDIVAEAIINTYTSDPQYKSLLFSVGDIINSGNSESSWQSEFFDPAYPNIRSMTANIPFQSCMGNHEGDGLLFQKYFPYPFVDDRYWSFDYGPAHFVMLDQYVNYDAGSAQYNWLENDLATTTKAWKFIVLHEPGWSAGDGHGNDLIVQQDIQPLCETYGVFFVFAGHNHYYARAMVNDVQHITTGGGGAPPHNPNLGYPNIVTATSAYHFCKVAIDGCQLVFEAVTPDGVVIDSFVVTNQLVAVGPGVSPPVANPLTLHPPYPNPFNPSVRLSFSIAEISDVGIVIYTISGRRVRTLNRNGLEAGRHSVAWNGKNDSGADLSSGVYLYTVHAGGVRRNGRLVLVR